MQGDDPLQVVGEVGAMLGLALGEVVAWDAVGVGQMVDAGEQGAEILAVGRDPADRDAAEADAVIAALAADQPGLGPLASGAVVGQGDLKRGVDRLDPLLVKKMRSSPFGVICARREANWKASGWPMLKQGA